jgi:hypothetical protein
MAGGLPGVVKCRNQWVKCRITTGNSREKSAFKLIFLWRANVNSLFCSLKNHKKSFRPLAFHKLPPTFALSCRPAGRFKEGQRFWG